MLRSCHLALFSLENKKNSNFIWFLKIYKEVQTRLASSIYKNFTSGGGFVNPWQFFR